MTCRRVNRLALVCLALLLALVCSLGSVAAGVEAEDAATADECEVPRDCGAGSDCIMGEEGLRVCVRLFCTQPTHCDDPARPHCNLATGHCQRRWCDTEFAPACADGLYCLNDSEGGRCVSEVELPVATSCEIVPARAVLVKGQAFQFEGAVLDAMGLPVPYPALRFASLVPRAPDLDAAGRVQTSSRTPPGRYEIVAQHRGQATCRAELVVLPVLAPEQLRVVLLEASDGAAVSGATVHADVVRLDGMQRRVPVTEQEAGTYLSTLPESYQLQSLVVQSRDHDGISVVEPDTRDLRLAAARSLPSDEMAGIKGDLDFARVHTRGDISIGWALLSHPAPADGVGLFELTMSAVVPRDINLEGVGTFEDVPFGTATYLKVGAADIKADFQVLGPPGTRLLSACAANVRLSEIGPLISSTGGVLGGILFGGTGLGHAAPWLGADCAPPRSERLEPIPRPDHGEPQQWDLPEAVLAPSIPGMAIRRFAIGTLPISSFADLPAVGAAVAVGVQIPGRGFLPLGFGRSLDVNLADESPDQIVAMPPLQGQPGPWLEGVVQLSHAPQHSGLEGYPLEAMLLAGDVVWQLPAPRAESIRWVRGPLPVGAETTVPVPAFLSYPVDYYDATSRQLTVSSPAGADLLRVVFRCIAGRHLVLLPARDQSQRLPILDPGMPTCDDTVLVEAIELSGGRSYRDALAEGLTAGGFMSRQVQAVARQSATVAR